MGPNYNLLDDEDTGDELLFQAYRSAMLQARDKSISTVGFSLLSAGIFRGSRPLSEVLKIGLLAVEANVYPALEEVFLVAFTEREVRHASRDRGPYQRTISRSDACDSKHS